MEGSIPARADPPSFPSSPPSLAPFALLLHPLLLWRFRGRASEEEERCEIRADEGFRLLSRLSATLVSCSRLRFLVFAPHHKTSSGFEFHLKRGDQSEPPSVEELKVFLCFQLETSKHSSSLSDSHLSFLSHVEKHVKCGSASFDSNFFNAISLCDNYETLQTR